MDNQEPLPTNRWAGARVLLVDDDAVNRILTSQVIANVTGLQPDTACDGAEACELAKLAVYDLVLMDLQMSGLDGVQATQLIRANSGPAGRVPIVALTASLWPEVVARCHAAGMNGHLVKPLTAADLQALRCPNSACSI